MAQKRLLSIDDLIHHMKVGKGIRFDIVSEEEAKHFLCKHNYYFKLASYRKNYNKAPLGINKGKYINLDFAYLKDLSTIDYELRYLILQMCLDIEHALKTILLNDIEKNPAEDGYNIVSLWDANLRYRAHINSYLNNSYHFDLIKYSPEYPVWVIFELISFGELCKFIEFYEHQYPKRLPFDYKALFPVRNLRNAAAHNACLINDVRAKSQSKPNPEFLKFVQSIPSISKRLRQNKLANRPLHDFSCLLWLYPKIVHSEPMRKQKCKDIRAILQRMQKHKEYYSKNAALVTTYKFIAKLFYAIEKNY